MRKRILSIILCALLCLSLMPTVAFAAEAQEITQINISAPVAYRAGGAMPSISDITVADDAPYTVVGVQTTYLDIATTGPLTAGEKYRMDITFHPKDGYYFKSDYSGMYTEAEYTINGGLSSSGLTHAEYVVSEYSASLYPNARVGDAVVYYYFTALPMTQVTANTTELNLYPGIFYETAKSIVKDWKLTENTVLIYTTEKDYWVYFYYAPNFSSWVTARYINLDYVLSDLDEYDIYILGTTKEATTYTVTFDMNGHGTQVAAQTVVESKKAAKPADPTAEGYTFSGWYKESTCDTPFDFDSAITSATTVYAKWTKNATTYTVTFDMNGHGGTAPSPITNVAGGSKINAPASPNANEEYGGYSFIYWYWRSDSGALLQWDFDSDTVTKDMTLYALWLDYPTIREVITKDGEPYTGLTVERRAESSQVTYTMTEKEPGVYEYVGIKPDAGYDLYINGVYMSSYYVNIGEQCSVTNTKYFSVKYDPNGQQFTDETAPDVTVCYTSGLWSNDKITRPESPEAVDPAYRFAGWTNGPEVDSGEYDFTKTISGTTTIYAQWERVTDENTFLVTAVRSTISGSRYAEKGKDYKAVLSPVAGYELPYRATSDLFDSWTHVKVDGVMLDTDKYTINLNTGEILISGECVTGDIEIVTYPRRPAFVVTFNANGGSGVQETVCLFDTYNGYAYCYGYNPYGWLTFPDCTFTPPDGKVFAYWNLGPNNYNEFYPGTSRMTFKNEQYYAVWKDAPDGVFTVAYDLTGCSFTGKTNTEVGKDYISTLKPQNGYGYPITLTAVTVGGTSLNSQDYTFNAETGALTISGDKITGNIVISASATKVYTVSFMMNGHGTQVAAQTIEEGSKAAKPTDPSESGWSFEGWYQDATFSAAFDFDTAITANTTIYAKWTETTHTVSFNPVLGSLSLFADIVNHGDTVAKPADPSAEGYRFTGWYTDQDCINEFNFDTPITEDIELLAGWIKTYKVSFDMNSHGTQVAAQTIEEGSKVAKPTDPSESGWTFEGWYQDATFSAAFDFNTAINADTTIYARWTKNTTPPATTYTVTFNMNGHGDQIAAQTVNEGAKATKPADPTAEGWTFDGWYADATFSAAFDFNTAINADTTIYAKWTKNTTPPTTTYTIIAGANGEWTKGSTTGLAFTSDAPFDKFDSVKVDGSTIAATNYTAEAGSTKITLVPAYLETLSVGSHSIVVVSTDGTASTNFTVKEAAQPPVPAKYTVSFNMNGHGTQIADQTVEDGSKAAKPADPKASGYTFGGWYADATFSTKFDFNTAITANTTVYAKWTKNSAAPADPTNPQTGDNSNMFLWIALLLVSGGALVGTAVYGKKKKYRAE